MTRDPRLKLVLEELAQLIEDRLARHPSRHLLRHRRPSLDLSLSLPVRRDAVDPTLIEQLDDKIDVEVAAHLAHRAILNPGHVYCLRCTSAECEHSAAGDERQVFAGYGPSGMPRFLDFGQWILERQHPQLDNLYSKPPRLVTDVISGRELQSQLLPAFKDKKTDFRLHGQVTAGWFQVPRPGGGLARLALTCQVLSSARGRGKRRRGRHLGLNLLLRGVDGEGLETLYDRMDHLPWAAAIQWSHEALESIERSQGKPQVRRDGKPSSAATAQGVESRIDGILQGFARRLQHDRRSRERRTEHAQQRHREGDRPTRLAHTDLATASDDRFLYDLRRHTLIVLGPRGRAHVWSADGKLVTSLRASPDSVKRKQKQKIWRPATAQEVISLRKVVGVSSQSGKTPS